MYKTKDEAVISFVLFMSWRNCRQFSLQGNSETVDEERIMKSILKRKRKEGTYEQWRQECREKQRFYYRKSKGKVKDPTIAKRNEAKRKEEYRKRVERLKRNGMYEACLAKRRKQALSLYHRVDEEGVCKRKEREKKRYREPIDKLKKTGAYRAHLDKCNARTKARRRTKKINGESVYGSKSKEQVNAEGRERYRRRIERTKREGTYLQFVTKNRVKCQSYREKVKEMKAKAPFISSGELMREMKAETPPVPFG